MKGWEILIKKGMQPDQISRVVKMAKEEIAYALDGFELYEAKCIYKKYFGVEPNYRDLYYI